LIGPKCVYVKISHLLKTEDEVQRELPEETFLRQFPALGPNLWAVRATI
jgi:hypothetical protein